MILMESIQSLWKVQTVGRPLMEGSKRHTLPRLGWFWGWKWASVCLEVGCWHTVPFWKLNPRQTQSLGMVHSCLFSPLSLLCPFKIYPKILGYLQYRAMKLNLTVVAMWVMPFDCRSAVISNPGRFQGNPQPLMVNHSTHVVWHQSPFWWSSKGDVMSKWFLSQTMTNKSWTCSLQGITLHFWRSN